MLKAAELQEAIRHINCMGGKEFEKVFGEEMGFHLYQKLHKDFVGNVAEFICYLDSANIEILTEELNRHNVCVGIAANVKTSIILMKKE